MTTLLGKLGFCLGFIWLVNATSGHCQTLRPDLGFGDQGLVEFEFARPLERIGVAPIFRKGPMVVLRYGYENDDPSRPIFRAISPDGQIRAATAAEYVDNRDPIAPPEQPVVAPPLETVACPEVPASVVRPDQYLALPCKLHARSPLATDTRIVEVPNDFLFCTRQCFKTSYLFLVSPSSTIFLSSISADVKTYFFGPDGQIYGMYTQFGFTTIIQHRVDGSRVGSINLVARFDFFEPTRVSAVRNVPGKIERLDLPLATLLDSSTWRIAVIVDVSQITTSEIKVLARENQSIRYVYNSQWLIKLDADGRPDPAYANGGGVSLLGLNNISDSAFDPQTGTLVSGTFVIDSQGTRREIADLDSGLARVVVNIKMAPYWVAADSNGRLLVSTCGQSLYSQGIPMVYSQFKGPSAAIFRLNANGARDNSFGTEGIVTGSRCGTLVPQSDGSITLFTSQAVERYDSNGTRLREDIFHQTPTEGHRFNAEVQPDGSIVAAHIQLNTASRYELKITNIPAALGLPTSSISVLQGSGSVRVIGGKVHVHYGGDIPAIFDRDGSQAMLLESNVRRSTNGIFDTLSNKIVHFDYGFLCNECDHPMWLVRSHADGTRDTAFGQAGVSARISGRLTGIRLGTNYYYLTGNQEVVILNKDGSVATLFGQGGRIKLGQVEPPWAFVQEKDAKMLLPTTHGLQRLLLPIQTMLPTVQDSDGDGVPDADERLRQRSPLWRDNVEALTDSQTYVRLAFRDLLNREVDASGLAYFVSEVQAQRITRASIYGQLFSSAEFEARMLPIVRLYSGTFLRTPDLEGLRYWHSRFASGETIDEIAEQFAHSPETVTRYGFLSNLGYVLRLYENILARAADVSGVSFWTSQLDAGMVTRGQLLARFTESPEYVAITRSMHLTDMAYLLILNRSRRGELYWLTQFDRGVPASIVGENFANSGEFAKRWVAECGDQVLSSRPSYCPR
jgi:hypothetical protein